MILPPLEIIESWPLPNYDDPITRGPAPIIFNLVLFPLVCFFIALRMYTRLCISKSFGLDDWLILATLFPTCAFATISLIAEFRYGWNRHIWDVDASTIPLGMKLVLASQVLFDAATTFTKLSMLTLTYRIIGSGSKMLRKATIGVMTVVAVQGTIFAFTVIFQCSPPSEYWTLSLTPQHCISEPANLLAAGIINTITDFLVVVLPIPTVWGLKLTGREQAILVFLFGAGFMVSIAGCVRTVYTFKVTVSNDRTWAIFPAWLSSCVELYVGIICASIPATKKFFSRYAPRLVGSSATRSRTAVSMQTKSTHSSSPTAVPDVEQGISYIDSSALPYERKNNETSSVQDGSSPDSRFSGFEFGMQKRAGTPQSSRNRDMDGLYGTSRVQSYDELIASANSSRRSHGAFG